jgi:hypothetical protein
MATSSPARCSRASRRQSRRSVSGLVAGGLGDQRRRDHLAAHPHACQQPGQLEAGRAGLVAGSQPAGITKAANEPADRGLVVDDPLDVGPVAVGARIATEMVSLWTSQTQVGWGEMRDTWRCQLKLAPP